jgi:uncharacterized protein YbcI
MKTQDATETAICEGMATFPQEYMGRGPKHIHAYLIGDFLVVRLQGALTAAEQQLVKSLSAEKGRDLLKQVRTQLVETARPHVEAMVQEVTGVKVVSMHHDISTISGGPAPSRPGIAAATTSCSAFSAWGRGGTTTTTPSRLPPGTACAGGRSTSATGSSARSSSSASPGNSNCRLPGMK